MKKIILTLTIALISLTAISQKKEAKIRQTITTKIDTIMVDLPSETRTVSDSLVLSKIDQLQECLDKETKKLSSDLRSLRKDVIIKATSSSRTGNFIISALRNIIPVIPFIAAVFAIFFWLRYVYRRKLLRQDLIIKYIDRGETVPEWLTKGEYQPAFGNNPTGDQENNSQKLSSTNAKVFLVFSIILAALTFIWTIALINTNGWRSLILLLILAVIFGYATIWCFQQYLKRTE